LKTGLHYHIDSEFLDIIPKIFRDVNKMWGLSRAANPHSFEMDPDPAF
jgi:hypothetical protein